MIIFLIRIRILILKIIIIINKYKYQTILGAVVRLVVDGLLARERRDIPHLDHLVHGDGDEHGVLFVHADLLHRRDVPVQHGHELHGVGAPNDDLPAHPATRDELPRLAKLETVDALFVAFEDAQHLALLKANELDLRVHTAGDQQSQFRNVLHAHDPIRVHGRKRHHT